MVAPVGNGESTEALLKACRRWSSSRPVVGGVWVPAMASGDGIWRIGLQGSKDWLVISLFFRDLCAFSSKQMSSVSFINVSVFVRVPVWYP
jgi:hypothetical protein